MDLVEQVSGNVARLNAEGWPTWNRPAYDIPRRHEYISDEREQTITRTPEEPLPLRLMLTGDRLSFTLAGSVSTLVNPRGKLLRRLDLHTFIARGTSYYAPTLRSADLRPGRLVTLRREVDNPHDKNAVALHGWGARKPFGYVQRGRAASLASRIDRGELLMAIALSGPGPRQEGSAWILACSVADLSTLIGRDESAA